MNKDLNLKFQKVIEICTESFMQQWHIDLIKSAKVALGELENNVIAFEYDDGNYIVGIVCGNKIARYNVFNRFTKRTVLGDMTSDQTEIKNFIYNLDEEKTVRSPKMSFVCALFALQVVSTGFELSALSSSENVLIKLKEAFVKNLTTVNQDAYWNCNEIVLSNTNIFEQEVKPLFGKFQYFSTDLSWNSVGVKATDVEGLKKKYSLFKDREFTEEERAMLESNQTGEYYKPSENVINMVKKVAKSWERNPRLRKKNILLEGPTGTGKTQDSKVFADIIGLPYTKVTCFSDMDSSDVAGAIYPVLEDRKHYTKADIEFDPEGVFEELTGEFRSNATPEDVNKILESNGAEYVYYASEIVKAFENGWVLEVQEPTCIADAAVLLMLNSALESDGVLNLPNRTVKRHPDFICIMTTNRSYEGCRPLNQALRNRFNITRKVDLPSVESMADRLMSATGSKNKDLANEVASTIVKLNTKLEEIGINSDLSMRNAMDFVSDIEDGFNTEESVMEDLVWNITTDEEDEEEIVAFLRTSTRIFNM